MEAGMAILRGLKKDSYCSIMDLAYKGDKNKE